MFIFDRYAGWIEMSCPTHGLAWSWDAGIPFCSVCGYVPEGAVARIESSDNTLDNPSPDGR